MLNIFNLFLFLLALWILFMISSSNFSLVYIIFGIAASTLVSITSFYLKLIDEKSELLYLSFGFYRHFLKIFIKNFFSSLSLIVDLAIRNHPTHPTIHKIKFDSQNDFNPALLMVTLNMTTGLFSIGAEENKILVHAVNEKYFKQVDLQKIYASLKSVNDDNIV